MLKIIFVLILFPFAASANCEQKNEGFHTVATYFKDQASSYKGSLIPLLLEMKKGQGTLKSFYEPNLLGKLNSFKIQTGKTVCPVKEVEIEYPLLSKEVSYHFPLCEENGMEFNDIVLYDQKNSTLKTGSTVSLETDVGISENEKNKVQEEIKKFLKGKVFRGGIAAVLNPEEYTVKGFSFFKYQNTGLGLIVVKAESKKFNRVLNYEFELIFLRKEEKVWYIADSAYINPCLSGAEKFKDEPEDFEAIISEYKDQALYPNKVDPLKNFKNARLFPGEEIPSLIEFNSSLYFLDFGKTLFVLPKGLTLDDINQNADYGIISSKKSKK